MTDDPIIVCAPGLTSGAPCFRGTRVMQAVVDEKLEAGMTIDEILDEHRTLNRADLEAYNLGALDPATSKIDIPPEHEWDVDGDASGLVSGVPTLDDALKPKSDCHDRCT